MSISILGVNIKKIREEKNVSAAELAKSAGVGASTISQIESGKRQSLQTTTVEKISNALGVSTDELFGLEIGKEYIVSDLEETLYVILSSEEISLDGKEMTKEEKNKFLEISQILIDSIRFNRK